MIKILFCLSDSYKDYRSNEDYSLTPQFWLILAVRFAFVILFEVSLYAPGLNQTLRSLTALFFLFFFEQFIFYLNTSELIAGRAISVCFHRQERKQHS